jgi:predicted kinase
MACRNGQPTLVVVTGPPGSGKTTLAHALARLLGCPAICRDEIKEGMAHAAAGFVAGPGDELTMRTLPVFFGVLKQLLQAGVSTVAEAAFQDHVWRPGLEPLLEIACVRIVCCVADPEVVADRMASHRQDPRRSAHADAGPRLDPERFQWLTVDAPWIEVDTTDGYRPTLAEVVEFVGRRADPA